MYYEINVAKRHSTLDRYIHYFATAKRSLLTLGEAEIVLAQLRAAFPAPMYKVTVSRYDTLQCDIDI
jgi:hypothetical protein